MDDLYLTFFMVMGGYFLFLGLLYLILRNLPQNKRKRGKK